MPSPYPTLTAVPSPNFTRTRDSDVLANGTEAGYDLRRARNVRQLLGFEVNYAFMKDSELTTLESFYQTVGRHTSFTWTDPARGTSHTVFFDSEIESKYAAPGPPEVFWEVSFKLKEQ